MALQTAQFNPSHRDFIFTGTESMNNLYGFSSLATEAMIPMYNSVMPDFPIKAESGLSYAHMPVVSRKRPRDEHVHDFNFNHRSSAAEFSFLGEDFSQHLQLQQLELDSFITHHMEKVRLEVEERRRFDTRRVIASVGASMMKKLKSKDEEIQKMVKLNFALEERLKSLYIENQIWRDLAETNEATANTLRSNLEHVVAVVEDGKSNGVDDAESSCGSNYEEELTEKVVNSSGGNGRGGCDGRVCRSCGKEEASVLLLPCRHLCLCGVCGSSVHICPICNSVKNCTLYVNMSS